MRTITECFKLKTFEERFEYLKLVGWVAEPTFGSDRYLNQRFYQSSAWLTVRRLVIVRDSGYDLGIESAGEAVGASVHHINPITIDDIRSENPSILNPEFLICVSSKTHKAIHYGSVAPMKSFPERTEGDTTLWTKTF
jgi:hypothetical protein